jgi:excisionase family DNA binding protein
MIDILQELDHRASAMTITECADLLGIEHNTLYRHARSGKFPTFQVAGLIRVNPAALASHIRASSKAQPIDCRSRPAA